MECWSGGQASGHYSTTPLLHFPLAYLNENSVKLQAATFFPEYARRVREGWESNPLTEERLICCGIGDVTEPLPRAAIDAMHKAIDDLGRRRTFFGDL